MSDGRGRFLKGVNVGGSRTFRPSALAKELKRFDVVNVGAAGTFVFRKPVGRLKLRAERMRRLPFAADVMICDGSDVLRLAAATILPRRRRGQLVHLRRLPQPDRHHDGQPRVA
jgi:hypothetical protein